MGGPIWESVPGVTVARRWIPVTRNSTGVTLVRFAPPWVTDGRSWSVDADWPVMADQLNDMFRYGWIAAND